MKSKLALKKINQYWADNNVLGSSNISIENEDWDAIINDLEKLSRYRDLFEKIKKSDQTLEYTGDELVKYYEEIENDQ